MLKVYALSIYLIFQTFYGGKRVRTADPLRARQVLSQLSYTPNVIMRYSEFGLRNYYSTFRTLSSAFATWWA
jgi:hypothetical protein